MIPLWRWLVLLQLILLLVSAGLFASYGMIAPMIVTIAAFALGLFGMAFFVDSEDNGPWRQGGHR